MTACQAMTEGGGWPLTIFLTPDLEPVYAGTYFPPEDRFGRPGFPSILEAVAEAWQDRPDELRKQAGQLVELIQQQRLGGSPRAVGEDDLERALAAYERDFDARYGGFGGRPNFHRPRPSLCSFASIVAWEARRH